jgi:hypothetical protein
MNFIIDSLIVFSITFDSLKIFNLNAKSFEFGNYKIQSETLKISTSAISGLKNYKILNKDESFNLGKIYFEKGKSANYFIVFFERKNWHIFGITEKQSSIWINDSVIDLIDGQFFYKKINNVPYKLKVIKNKMIILKEYNFK